MESDFEFDVSENKIVMNRIEVFWRIIRMKVKKRKLIFRILQFRTGQSTFIF